MNRQVPADRDIHIIVDNDTTHKHPKVQAWLARHPRWTVRLTPTSASWLNAVEGVFAALTKRRLKRGVFHSVVDLQQAINAYVAEHNETHAKPFIWKVNPEKIIAARTKRVPNVGFNPLAIERPRKILLLD